MSLQKVQFCTVLFLLPLISTVAFGQISGEMPTGSEPIEIRIHANATSPTPIPSTIFGSFLEPIGHSTYGGLWAELLENPSFESGMWTAQNITRMLHEDPDLGQASSLDLPLPWEPLDAHQGNRYEPHRGDAANSNQSLLIMGLPQAEVGIRQRVYLPIHRVLKFNGSLWAKHVSGASTLDVSLRGRNHPDKVLAHFRIDAPIPRWTKYYFTLGLKAGDLQPLEPADFAITLTEDARVMVDEVSLMPEDNVDGMDPEEIQMARDLKSPIVRFGGNFTSSYHWRDGIGPRDKRVSMLNLAWGIPEYNTFGTDEFLRFCKLIGAEPQIALNLGSGSPDEAAAWVRYVNEHWANRKGGLLWELGNELWGNWNMGYPPLMQIGQRTERFSQAIRNVDPAARLIATGADPDSYHDWNSQQLATDPGTFNYLSTHFVVTNSRVKLPDPTNDFLALSAFALPVGLAEPLREMNRQIQQSKHKNARIAFTEWLFLGRPSSDGGHAPTYSDLGGAIDTAGFLDMLMQNADIVPISDMTGLMEFAGIWKKRGRVYGAPGYWVLRMYANESPKRLMRVENSSPAYSVQNGSTRLPEIKNVPWLEVIAAQGATSDKLVLFCVNRDLKFDLDARITLEGFKPVAEGRVQTLTGPSIYSENDETHPDAVIPRSSMINAGDSFDYKFPHASVVVIELERKGS